MCDESGNETHHEGPNFSGVCLLCTLASCDNVVITIRMRLPTLFERDR